MQTLNARPRTKTFRTKIQESGVLDKTRFLSDANPDHLLNIACLTAYYETKGLKFNKTALKAVSEVQSIDYKKYYLDEIECYQDNYELFLIHKSINPDISFPTLLLDEIENYFGKDLKSAAHFISLLECSGIHCIANSNMFELADYIEYMKGDDEDFKISKLLEFLMIGKSVHSKSKKHKKLFDLAKSLPCIDSYALPDSIFEEGQSTILDYFSIKLEKGDQGMMYWTSSDNECFIFYSTIILDKDNNEIHVFNGEPAESDELKIKEFTDKYKEICQILRQNQNTSLPCGKTDMQNKLETTTNSLEHLNL